MISNWLQQPSFLFFASSQPVTLYYSHLPSIVIPLLIGILVFSNNRKDLSSKLFFVICLCFSLWSLIDLTVWTNINSDVVFFLWLFYGLLYAAISVLSVYFIYVFYEKKDVPWWYKFVFFLVLVPILIFTPTKYNLSGFNFYLFGASGYENTYFLTYYTLTGALAFVWIFFLIVRNMRKVGKELRRQVLLLGSGMELFLVLFFTTSFLASYLNDIGVLTTYDLEFYGLIGMVVFLGLITYIIVRFRAFNVKLIGAQALIAALIILVASEFSFTTNLIGNILTGVTLVLACIFGYFLVKSVQREIKAKEDLEVANAGQTNLIHIINHQIKGYLAKGRNAFAELLEEPRYGTTEMAKPLVRGGFDALTEGIDFVQQVLTSSSAEKGTLQYNMASFDFKALVLEVATKQKDRADEKHLSYGVVTDNSDYTIVGDASQLKEAVRNLIDNSIIYTPSGSVTVSLVREQDKVLFSVKDTGLGIADSDKMRLFTTGGRGKDSIKVNANSTGYGLAFVKGVATAHKGRVWAESAGPGKGSQFYMELPVGR